MSIDIKGPILGQGQVCEPILHSLPEWFGIQAANQQYIQDISDLPTFMACVGDQAIGFMTVKYHNRFSAEIYVCGVRPEYHRHGLGKALLNATEGSLKSEGIEYLQVKTLGPSHPDEAYARTRLFYEKMGFRPLEEIPAVWGPENPCLVMIKYIGLNGPARA